MAGGVDGWVYAQLDRGDGKSARCGMWNIIKGRDVQFVLKGK